MSSISIDSASRVVTQPTKISLTKNQKIVCALVVIASIGAIVVCAFTLPPLTILVIGVAASFLTWYVKSRITLNMNPNKPV